MNIIICGAGQVGYSIANQLSQQGHSITVIDKTSADIQKINDNLDAKGIVGIATYPSVLELAEAKGLQGEEAEDFAEKYAYEKLEECSI